MIIFFIGLSLLFACITFVAGFIVGAKVDSDAALRHEEWKAFHGIGPLYGNKEKQS